MLNDALKIHKVKEWLLLNEFYFLVEKARLLLLSAASFSDLSESKESIDDMVDFLIHSLLKNNIEPDDLSHYELPINYRKIQVEDGYNTVYYKKMCDTYLIHSNLFNYIVDGRYKEFRKRNQNW